MNSEFTIVVIGLGNIGLNSVYMLSGMDITTVILIDHDRFSKNNIGKQNIGVDDIGKLKVDFCAETLQQSRPELRVETHQLKVQQVPVGRLARADLFLVCVDNMAGRQYVNELAWNFNTPWIDSAVGFDRYARVRVMVPAADHACLECGWSDADYGQLEATYPCQRDQPSYASTTSTLELGAIAAGLQCFEAKKIRTHEIPSLSFQIFLDLREPKLTRYTFSRNPRCRFSHLHLPGPISGVALSGDLMSLGASHCVSQIGGAGFLLQVICTICHLPVTLQTPLIPRAIENVTCECGGSCNPLSIASSESLSIDNLSAAVLTVPLASFGFKSGDVIVVDDQTYEIGLTHGN